MLRDVETQDKQAGVADDKETVEDAERDRGHGEEVHRCNRFPVILKKCAPTLGWPGISGRALHPARDGSLGDVKAQHEELAVNARSTPDWVLRHHAEDQLPNFPRQSFPADLFSHLRDHAPVHAKPRAVPTYDCLWANDNERTASTQTKSSERAPRTVCRRLCVWAEDA